MKINKINQSRYKLIKLQLIKTKTYHKNYINFVKINIVTSRLKKALQLINAYHINHKRILFLFNNINPNFKKIIKNSKHNLLTEDTLINGLITNPESFFKLNTKSHKLLSYKKSKVFHKTEKKIDLVVTFNDSILEESYLTKIPTIALNCELNIINYKYNYKLPINLNLTKKNSFFYHILSKIIKKKLKRIKTKNEK